MEKTSWSGPPIRGITLRSTLRQVDCVEGVAPLRRIGVDVVEGGCSAIRRWRAAHQWGEPDLRSLSWSKRLRRDQIGEWVALDRSERRASRSHCGRNTDRRTSRVHSSIPISAMPANTASTSVLGIGTASVG